MILVHAVAARNISNATASKQPILHGKRRVTNLIDYFEVKRKL